MKKFLVAALFSLVLSSAAFADCTYEMYEAYVEQTGDYEMTWAEFEMKYEKACIENPNQCFGEDISIEDFE